MDRLRDLRIPDAERIAQLFGLTLEQLVERCMLNPTPPEAAVTLADPCPPARPVKLLRPAS